MNLYDAVVPSFLQLVGSLRDVLDKGAAYALERGSDPQLLADARLIGDMFPLHLQIRRVANHSSGALADVQRGKSTWPVKDPCSYREMQTMLAEAEASLRQWSLAAVNALEGREMIFDMGASPRSYTAEAYLILFSLPNCYFHGVTAYDILRAQGVPIGKVDFLSQHRQTLR